MSILVVLCLLKLTFISRKTKLFKHTALKIDVRQKTMLPFLQKLRSLQKCSSFIHARMHAESIINTLFMIVVTCYVI